MELFNFEYANRQSEIVQQLNLPSQILLFILFNYISETNLNLKTNFVEENYCNFVKQRNFCFDINFSEIIQLVQQYDLILVKGDFIESKLTRQQLSQVLIKTNLYEIIE